MPHAKFHSSRRELAESLIEREEEIDLVLTGLIAGENVLLVGPPGCAKSLLLDALLAWMKGRRFSVLLTRFSTPEDVLEPISVAGLKADVYRRVTTGRLPEADMAFIDEVFKASSAILNTLLKILNERTYEVGDGTSIRVPLRLCVAASNEWPSPETSKELAALVADRNDSPFLNPDYSPVLEKPMSSTKTPPSVQLQRRIYREARTSRPVSQLTTALLDRRNLDAARDRIFSNDGANTPGVDGVTADEVRSNDSAWLTRLADDLLHRRYRPAPIRIIEIPKPNKPGQFRKLGILTLRDRLYDQYRIRLPRGFWTWEVHGTRLVVLSSLAPLAPSNLIRRPAWMTRIADEPPAAPSNPSASGS